MDINNQLKKLRLSGDQIKIIACILMAIDHISFCLLHYYMSAFHMEILPETYTLLNKYYTIGRGIGRLAFPLFCYFIVEGFVHTRNIYKYASRLLIFAILSEIPFNLAHYHQFFHPEHQNTLFSMFLGLLLLIVIKYVLAPERYYSTSTRFICVICSIAGFCELASLTHVDYSYKGILLIAVLYLFHEAKSFQLVSGAAICAWEANAPASFILLYFYDPSIKPRIKYFFYLFYPLHLMLIYLLSLLLF